MHHHEDGCVCEAHHEHHDHGCGCGCGCGCEHTHETTKKSRIAMAIGVALFAAALTFHLLFPAFRPAIVYPIAMGAAYLLIGGGIVLSAAKGLLRGNWFGEEALMSVASIGAFLIGEYPEAVAVVLLFRIGEALSAKAAAKNRASVIAAVDMRPETVTVLHDGKRHRIPAKEVHVGDEILILVGERIPLDAVVLSGESRLDTSFLTGEPVPVSVAAGDEITSGALNLEGALTARVVRELRESAVSRIVESMEHAAESKPRAERVITRFARVYTPAVLIAAIVAGIVISLISGDVRGGVYTALTFLVVSCPCALVISVPLSFFCGIGAASKQGILFKTGVSFEQLRRVKAFVFDKTGTLTEGHFAPTAIVPQSGEVRESLLALTASLEKFSTHPIAKSIVAFAETDGVAIPEAADVSEESGGGLCGTVAGHTVAVGNAQFLAHFTKDDLPKTDPAYTVVHCACDGRYVGHILLGDTVKPSAAPLMKALFHRGTRTHLLTGDREEVGVHLAETLGMDGAQCELKPDGKLKVLESLRAQEGAVAFVGDGINDAPVIAGADVGIAMCSGADASVESADIVVMQSDLSAISAAVGISEKTHRIVVQNIAFPIVLKVLIMVLSALGLCGMWAAVLADTGTALLCTLNATRARHFR